MRLFSAVASLSSPFIYPFSFVWGDDLGLSIFCSDFDLYPSSVWLSRELFDMFGTLPYGSPDRRRILTDYGFQGHPLLKSFPPMGFEEVGYDSARRSLARSPLAAL